VAFTYVTVARDYDLATSEPPTGGLYFTPSDWMVNDGVTIVPAPRFVPLDSAGVAQVTLAANTDPATLPADTTYTVREVISGQPERTYQVTVPHNLGPAVSLGSNMALLTQDLADARYEQLGIRVNEAPLSLLDPRVACVLDGTGDQASKVATAVSLLPSTGGHIYQPRGTLRTSAITFDRPVRWEGAGDQASTIQAAAGFTGTVMTVSSTAPYSRVSDVQIAGGGSATYLLRVASARTRLDHLHFTGQDTTGGAAIHFDGVSSVASAHAGQMTDIRIIDCDGYGVWLQGFSYDNEFHNLWIGNCNVGIRYENTNGMFTNTHVWGCLSNGVELRDGNHLFSNCYVETCVGSGFNLFNAPRVRLSNCNIWKNQGQGASLSGTSHRFAVVGSLIYDNGGNGVQAADCLHGQVIGNQFYDDTGSAQTQDRPVVTTGTSDHWTIVGNTMVTSEHATGANSLVGANNRVFGNNGETDAGVGLVAITSQTTSYTLVLGDGGKAVEMNSASALNLTVPPNSAVAFPVGTVIETAQIGAGQVTLVPGSGVTLRSPNGLRTRAQYSSVSLRKKATDEWVVAGDVVV
jgi:hypothetical protein